MSWAMVGAAAISVVGGMMQSDSASRAADDQQKAAKDAQNKQYAMYQQQREDNLPWREAGQRALIKMEDGEFQRDFSQRDFQKDGGYNFRLEEGQKALDAAMAARGMGNSGAAIKAGQRYMQDFASNEYNNAYNRYNTNLNTRFNRLSSLSGNAQTANGQLGSAAQNYGAANAQSANAIGGAQSANAIAQGNATNGALQGVGNAMIGYAAMNKSQPAAQPTQQSAGQNWKSFDSIA